VLALKEYSAHMFKVIRSNRLEIWAKIWQIFDLHTLQVTSQITGFLIIHF